jgi:hypothetical protein
MLETYTFVLLAIAVVLSVVASLFRFLRWRYDKWLDAVNAGVLEGYDAPEHFELQRALESLSGRVERAVEQLTRRLARVEQITRRLARDAGHPCAREVECKK